MINTPTVRQCTGPCKKILPLTSEYFHTKNGRKTQLKYECKQCACERERNRVRHMKRCIGPCQRILPNNDEYFYVHNSKRLGRKPQMSSRCKQCHALYSKERRGGDSVQKKQHVDIDVSVVRLDDYDSSTRRCESCGTSKGNIINDEDTVSKECRGYLCAPCYRLSRLIRGCEQGDPQRLKKILAYNSRTTLKKPLTLQT